MESPSGNVGLDSGAFLLVTESLERTNQIVACPITRVAHRRTSEASENVPIRPAPATFKPC